jgi:hypothetical protein
VSNGASSTVISIHGAAGQARPLIKFTAGNFRVYNASDTVADIAVEGPGTNPSGTVLETVNGGTVDRVVVHATADNGVACFSRSSSLWRDSVCWASGANAVGFEALENFSSTKTTTLRNMTIEAPGAGSTALFAFANSSNSNLTVNTFNTITGGATDITAKTDSTSGTTATVNVSHGNWSTPSLQGTGTAVNDDGTKQAARPVFIDAVAGDFHEADTSPTIDAGVDASANGVSDFDGDPRVAGLRTDIGADEFETAPAASTASPTSVTMTTATLNGTVHPDTIATTYHFDFGQTAAYGKSTPETSAVGTAPQTVSTAIAGLAPGTPYHARLVAKNASGTAYGNDVAFTTLAAPPLSLPTISGAQLTHTRFRVAAQATAISAKSPLGTTFRFTISTPAKLEIAITRSAPGLRRGLNCVAPTAKLRRKHAKRCKRTLLVGTLTRSNEPQGTDSVSFSGRIGQRALRPGAYQAVLTASNATGRSKPAALAFVVVH